MLTGSAARLSLPDVRFAARTPAAITIPLVVGPLPPAVSVPIVPVAPCAALIPAPITIPLVVAPVPPSGLLLSRLAHRKSARDGF